MDLTEKYRALIEFAKGLGLTGLTTRQDGSTLYIEATSEYPLEKDLFWDRLKAFPGWETEIVANIRTVRNDIHGFHIVQSGESLSKIAKRHLDDANRYMDIFTANKDVLKDPDKIQPGQRLLIPRK